MLLPDGETVSVRVRASDRARTTRILLGPERAPEIILACGIPPERAAALLESRGDWVAGKLAESRTVSGQEELGLRRLGALPFDGAHLPVWAIRGSRPRVSRTADGGLRVYGPDEQTMGAAIERWYRREARRLLGAVVDREAGRLGVGYCRLSVRDPRRRWGSCSSRAHISLSWRLVLVPEMVRAHVVVHELLHLRIPNHGRGFWRLVEAADPGWRESVAWLRRHGAEVRNFDPEARIRRRPD